MTRYRLAPCGLLPLLSCTVHAECQLDQVKLYDQQLNTAIIEHDVAKAKSLYADNFVLTTSRGTRKYTADMLRDIADTNLSLSANATHEINVIGNQHTAVLYAGLHQSGTFNGQPFDVELLVTDTWSCGGDRWRLLAGHAGPAHN